MSDNTLNPMERLVYRDRNSLPNFDFCPRNFKHEFQVMLYEKIRCIHCGQIRDIEKPKKSQ